MNNLNLILKKTIKGALLVLGIYFLLTVVPRTKLDDRDILIISLVLFVAYLFYENLIVNNAENKAENLDPTISSEQKNTFSFMMPDSIKVEEPIFLPQVKECDTCKIDIKDNNDVKKISNDEGNIAHTYQPIRKYPSVGSRMNDGILTNEIQYTDYNTLPIGANIDSKIDDFTYTFLPPDKWYPVPPHPPICITEKQCPVCPITTTGTLANLKEWSEASRVTPGDQINTTYLNEKLNSGR